jgi:sporulation integral membrane protein YlbJ
MQRRLFHTRSRTFTLMLGLLAASFVISIIIYPDQAFQASLHGLRLWWEQVFPALLPVLVVTELLLGLGIVHGLGVLLDPLMRRLFRIPGSGGWAMAAGLIGGYPLGADAASKLRKRGDIGQAAAERLLSISHLCNPMLMVGVVGAGFLHSPEAGVMLAILHYAAAAAAGLIQSFTGPAAERKPHDAAPTAHGPEIREGLLTRASRSMQTARGEDGRAFGKLLGDAVAGSIQALMMIGGLIMIFSVAVKIADLQIGGAALSPWLLRLLPGVLEPHLGAFAFSRSAGWIPSIQAAAIGACLAWSGFSLHAQVLSFTKGTDIRYGPFLRFRMLHAAAAAVLTLLAWEPLGRLLQGTEAVFSPSGTWALTPGAFSGEWSFREAAAAWGSLFTMLALLLALMLLLSLAIRMLEHAANKHKRRV